MNVSIPIRNSPFSFGRSVRFHLKHGLFNVREQFSDLGSGLVSFLLFPFFIWLCAQVWDRFNAYQGNYTIEEVKQYVGITEILFLTFLRPASLSKASSDFSIALARPRSWMVTSISGLYGRCLGSRLIHVCLFIIFMPLLGVSFHDTITSALRLLLFLPVLGVFQAFINLSFSIAQVMWHETNYFILPVSKIFLALGGVFGPLVDFGEPWRSRLLMLPASDTFFQIGHFCIKGSFYQLTEWTWGIRILVMLFILGSFNFYFYKKAKQHHQSYGG